MVDHKMAFLTYFINNQLFTWCQWS